MNGDEAEDLDRDEIATAPVLSARRAKRSQPTQWVHRAFTAAVLAGCVLTIFLVINGSELFTKSTPTGGDMAGHVWWPAYLRDHLLPSGRLSGWSMDMYGGFPAGQFYFPVPALIILLLNVLLPYGIAFKIGAALGVLLLPIAVWSFAKRMGWRDPAPQFAAVASVMAVLFSGETQALAFNQRIAGGSVASMLVGEFSYSWGLVFMFLALGNLATFLRTGRRGWLAALCCWLVIWSHVIVAIMTAVFAIGLILIALAKRNVFRVIIARAGAVGLAAALASAAWFLPFFFRWESWTTAPRYDRILTVGDYLFTPWFRWMALLAVFGFGAWAALTSERLLNKEPVPDWALLEACGFAAVSALVFWLWPEGVAWNLRFLPFWYFFVAIAAAVVVASLVRVAGEGVTRWVVSGAVSEAGTSPRHGLERMPEIVLSGIAITALLFSSAAVWGGAGSLLDGWSRGNWQGFEGRNSYQEYRELVTKMDELPPGAALWEKATENGSDNLSIYGSDFALVLLPFWTNGRIPSFESLYFEASATTGYLFLTTAHVARNPSNLVRGLPYVSPLAEFEDGVAMMRTLGVRYYMAQSPEAIAKAEISPGLKLRAQVPDYDGAAPRGWNIYEVRDAAIVAPLEFEPVVTEVAGRDAWMQLASRWFERPTLLNRPLVQNGPKSWARVDASDGSEPDQTVLNALTVPEYRDEVIQAERVLNAFEPSTPNKLPAVTISKVQVRQDSVSFNVDRTGIPVQIRVSAYPNWVAHGADGPYRSSPNQMIVIPRAKHVEIRFERTSLEWFGLALTGLGIVGIGLLAWWPRRRTRLGTDSGR